MEKSREKRRKFRRRRKSGRGRNHGAGECFNSLFYKLGYYSGKIKKDYTVIITIFL